MRSTAKKLSLLSSTALLGSVFLLAVSNTANAQSDQIVNISSGTVIDAYGGQGVNTDEVINNQLTISQEGTVVTNNAFGGYGNAAVKENSVTLSNKAAVEGSVYGGRSTTSSLVTKNAVRIESGATVMYSVYGGYNDTGSDAGDVTYNTVTITGAGTNVRDSVFGGEAVGSGTVSYNEIHLLDGASVDNNLTGGSNSAGTGNITHNIISVTSGARVSYDVTGGITTSGNAANNTITIVDSLVGGSVIGGKTESGAATGNIINITNSNVVGDLLGGFAQEWHTPKDLVTGNTLNLFSPLKMASGSKVGNFEHYNFHIGADVKDGDTMLDVTSAVEMAPHDGTGGVVKSKVTIKSISVNTQLSVGDKITLVSQTDNADISVIGGTQTPKPDGTTTLSAESGISTIYEFDVAIEGAENAINATMTKGKTNNKANAVTAGNNAGFLNTLDATLFAATDGLASFLAATPAADGLVTFGAAGGRSTSYDNGQNIDLEGFNFMVGAGATREIGGGDFHLAGFAETGKQTYDATSHLVSGKGNVDYMGGGAMARLNLYNGLYAEGLVRAGMADISYDTKDFATPVSYDFSSAYVGGYAGLGYNTEVCDGVSWGLHGKYIYSWMDGNEAHLAGEYTRFEAASAHTFRLGTSLAYEMDGGFTPYGFVAWDYTTGSDMEAIVKDKRLETTDIDGHTGTLQLGLRYAQPESNWSADLSASGYTGEREGLAANAAVKLMF